MTANSATDIDGSYDAARAFERLHRGATAVGACLYEWARGYTADWWVYTVRRVRLRGLLRRKHQQPGRRAYDRELAARQQVGDMKRVQQRLKDQAGRAGAGGAL